MNVYVKLQIKGRNLDLLLKTLILKKIELFGVNKSSDLKCVITILEEDRRKVFAICNNMCYNVRIVGYGGSFALVYFLRKNLPVIIGIAIFSLLFIFFSGRLISIDCKGSGKIFQDSVLAVAENCGAKKYSRLKDLDLKYTEKEILKSNPLFSFVNAKIRGNRLIISVYVNENPPEKLSEKVADLTSDDNGVILSVAVSRGTALVKEGDSVVKGQPLVGAYYEYKESVFPTFVSAKIVMLTSKSSFFETDLKTENVLPAYIELVKAEEGEEIKNIDAKFTLGGVLVTYEVLHIISGG